jgi:hypothetical protein
MESEVAGKKIVSGKKVATSDAPLYFKVGRNIKYRRQGDTLIIRVNLSADPVRSESGRADMLAQTNRFESLTEGCDEDIGLSMVVSKRVSKGK